MLGHWGPILFLSTGNVRESSSATSRLTASEGTACLLWLLFCIATHFATSRYF